MRLNSRIRKLEQKSDEGSFNIVIINEGEDPEPIYDKYNSTGNGNSYTLFINLNLHPDDQKRLDINKSRQLI